MRYSIHIGWRIVVALLVMAAGGVLGCNESAVSPGSEHPALPAVSEADFMANIEEGETGRGAKYALCVPDEWNGDLVLYAHGFIDVAMPIDLPTNDDWEPIRDALMELGYGVAYSSFCENGFAVKQGMQQTHQLRGLFASRFGTPQRTFLLGHSLGGAVAVALAEKHPQHYDGAMTMSGMIGGSSAQIDYVADMRILFDYCYPGVLPGSVVDIPDGLDLYTQVVIPIATAIQISPDCASMLTQVDQTPVPLSSGEEMVTSFATAIGFNIRGFKDVFDRTHSHMPVDNTDRVYTGALPPAWLEELNASVPRYQRTPDAEAYLSHYVEPTGDLGIPLLTLHNALDPSVPIFHEDVYEGLVAAEGDPDMFVRRTVTTPLYGHCTFGNTTEENVATIVASFLDLVAWVDTGVKPTF
jgi:pimeloyl-ACP methyl ester carboxylesterase